MLPSLGKLLVLPANVRLDWKVFARCKHSSLLGLVSNFEGKKFYNIVTWCQRYKTFFSSFLLPLQKATMLVAVRFLKVSLMLGKKAGAYRSKAIRKNLTGTNALAYFAPSTVT